MRRADGAPGGLAAGGMEDGGVLKEGFLVKRVSARASPDLVFAPGGWGAGPRAPERVPSSAPGSRLPGGRIGAWGSAGRAGGQLLPKRARAQARTAPISGEGVRVEATEGAILITAAY